MTPSLLMLSAIEAALARCLRLDPEIPPRAAALAGRVVAVEAVLAPGEQGLSCTFYLLFGPDGIGVDDIYAGEPDVVLRGTPLALVQFLRAEGPLAGDVVVTGDAGLAEDFRRLLGSIDVDWEEQIAYGLGDVAAHQLGNLVRGLSGWSRDALDTLVRDAGEYLQQEARDLPPRRAVAEFVAGVAAVSAGVERLEERVGRLRQSLEDAS